MLSLALLTSTIALPAADAAYAEPNAFRLFTTYAEQSFFSVAFHPDGDGALLVGGSFGEYSSDRYLVHYDGAEWQLVAREHDQPKGPFVDADWRPQGDHALVLGHGGKHTASVMRCDAPCTSDEDLTELWTPSVTALANEGQGFLGRQVAWHPSGEYALITGNALLQWNGEDFTVTESGVDAFYSAVAWHPSGEYALVQRNLDELLRCDAPCDSSDDLHALPYTFSKYGGYPAIERIAFSPDGERAYVTGVDTQHGLALELTVTSPDSSEWARRYIEFLQGDEPKYGEVTGVAWHPSGGYALFSSSLSMQVTRLNASGGDLQTLLTRSGMKLNSVAWHPDGAYALFPTRGGFVRYDPQGVPLVSITAPADGAVAEGVVEVAGTAAPKKDGLNVTTVEFRAVPATDPAAATPWTPVDAENLTTEPTGEAAWRVAWDAAAATPGPWVLAARASDGVVTGPAAFVTVCVPGALEAPTLTAPATAEANQSYRIQWTEVAGATEYVVQEADNAYFVDAADVATVAAGETALTLAREAPGEVHYRVRALGCGDGQSPWGAPANVTITPEPVEEAPGDAGEGDDGDEGGEAPGDTGQDAPPTNGSLPDDGGNETADGDGNATGDDPSTTADEGNLTDPGDEGKKDEITPDGEDPDEGAPNGTDPVGPTGGEGVAAPGAALTAAVLAALALTARSSRRPGPRGEQPGERKP